MMVSKQKLAEQTTSYSNEENRSSIHKRSTSTSKSISESQKPKFTTINKHSKLNKQVHSR